MLCGGGPLPHNLMETFFELGQAGQGSLVIIPSASSMADQGDFTWTLNQWQQFPWASVRVLHAQNREQIESDIDFVKPLQEATAVWISGGDQRRLAERYLGTPVERELKKVVNRGGIIGGTSAGSAIASRVMISGGREQPSSPAAWTSCQVPSSINTSRSASDMFVLPLRCNSIQTASVLVSMKAPAGCVEKRSSSTGNGLRLCLFSDGNNH